MSSLLGRLTGSRSVEPDNRPLSLRHLGATLLYAGIVGGIGFAAGNRLAHTDIFNGFALAINCLSNCDVRPYTGHLLGSFAAIYTLFRREDSTYASLSSP